MSEINTYLLENDTASDHQKSRDFKVLKPKLLRGYGEIVEAARHSTSSDRWILLHPQHVRDAIHAAMETSKRFGILFMLGQVDAAVIAPLLACCRRAIFSPQPKSFLPAEEMAEVLNAQNKRDLFIGGDRHGRTLTLWRGDGDPLNVSVEAFRVTGNVSPNFDAFSITDYGQTVKLGDYEASTDSLLYEYDPEYRARLRAIRRQSDLGFGSSLRRLRRQKGLTQDDFAPVNAKTIARIEQGSAKRPHRKTLTVIEHRLKMPAAEIETF
jgi:DNA-binding XRE family transcriptional regulator